MTCVKAEDPDTGPGGTAGGYSWLVPPSDSWNNDLDPSFASF